MSTTRRRFLKFGLGGVVLLAVPTLGLALRRSVLVEPQAPLQTFGPRQYATLCALADTFCPGGPDLPSASDLHIADTLDGLFARMHPGVGADLSAGLDLLENALAGALLDRRFDTFTASSPEERSAILLDWRTSSIRLRRAIYKALRGFVMAAYWSNPASWPHLGYGGMPDYSTVPSPPPFAQWIQQQEAPEGVEEETP